MNRYSKTLELSAIQANKVAYSTLVNVDSQVISLCATTSKTGQVVAFFITSQMSKHRKRSLTAAVFGKDQQTAKIVHIDFAQADSVKVFKTDTSVFLFAYSLDTESIYIYQTAIDTIDSSSYKQVYSISGVDAFDVFRNGTEFTVVATRASIRSMRLFSFSGSDASKLTRPENRFITPNRYLLSGMVCDDRRSASSARCAANSNSGYLIEFMIEYVSANTTFFNQTKYSGFDVRSLDYAGDYIVATASDGSKLEL